MMSKDLYVPSASLGKDQGQSEASREVAPPEGDGFCDCGEATVAECNNCMGDVEPPKKVPDFVLTAVNGNGEWRCSAYVDGYSCLEISEMLREWHETDPQRTIRIAPRSSLDGLLRRVSDGDGNREDRDSGLSAEGMPARPTPNPPPSGDIGELARVATPVEEIGGFLATIAAQAARIAELEKERDEARLEELRIWTFLGKPDLSKQRLSDRVKARLKDAVKVIEEIANGAACLPGYSISDAAQAARAFLSTTGGDNG